MIRRHEQALHAAMHKQFQVATDAGRVLVTLDIVPDEFDPYALLTALEPYGEQLAQVRVGAGFTGSAQEHVELDRERLSQARLIRSESFAATAEGRAG